MVDHDYRGEEGVGNVVHYSFPTENQAWEFFHEHCYFTHIILYPSANELSCEGWNGCSLTNIINYVKNLTITCCRMWMMITEEGIGNVLHCSFPTENQAWDFFRKHPYFALIILDPSANQKSSIGWNGFSLTNLRNYVKN